MPALGIFVEPAGVVHFFEMMRNEILPDRQESAYVLGPCGLMRQDVKNRQAVRVRNSPQHGGKRSNSTK